MATNFGAKFAKLALFGTLAFRNGLEDHNFHFRRLNDNDFATLCTN